MHLRLGSKPGLKRIFTCLVMPAVLFILFWVVHPGTAGAGNALEVKAAGYSAVSVTQTMTTANPVLSTLTLSGNPSLTYNDEDFYFALTKLTLAGTDQYGAPYDITGQKVTWAVRSGPATVAGTTLIITGRGTVNITATIGQVTSNNLSLTVSDPAGHPNPGLPDQITLSWTGDPGTTQTIAWRTGTDTTQDQIQYLPAGSFSGSFTGALSATAVKSDLYTGCSHFEVTLRELTPATSYVYRAGREGAWSEPATFTTAGTGNQFSFLYMGDVQQDYNDWGVMLNSAYAENPGLKFGLLGGDSVNNGSSVSEWQQFFANAAPVFKQIPLMPAAGNHDNKPLFWNSFALPQNGPEGYKENFYSFDYGNCHIAILDSNYLSTMNTSSPDYDKISTWLRNDLDNSNQQWKFLVFHHPPYPAAFDGYAANLQATWVPLFEQCRVDVVFVGHQHVYMRTKPLHGGQVQADPQDGIVYIMGNAGTKFNPPGDNYDYIAKELAYVSNYEVISIDGNTFSLTAKNAAGQVIDSFAFTKTQGGGAALYTVVPIADAAYQTGATPGGIETMTVNAGVSGMKYFGVQVIPVREHSGLEAVVFVHIRNGVQASLNVTKADFDTVHAAQAGFNALSGDLVKAFIVDDLTNSVDFNPTLLQ